MEIHKMLTNFLWEFLQSECSLEYHIDKEANQSCDYHVPNKPKIPGDQKGSTQ